MNSPFQEMLERGGWKRANATHWYDPLTDEMHCFGSALQIENDRIKFEGRSHERYLNLPKILRVFVYGSLLSGLRLNPCLQTSKFISKDSISGYSLYDLGSFPGIVRGTGKVVGEVYEISLDVLKELDRVEQNGYLYIRSLIKTDGGKEVFVYEMNNEIFEMTTIIPSGDWKAYIHA